MKLTANTTGDRLGVNLMFADEPAARLLPALLLQRETIEAELGVALDWVPQPARKQRALRVTRACDLSDRATWPDAVAWFVEGARNIQAVFLPRIDAIDRANAASGPRGEA